jgi:hypothetical protein
VTHWIDERIQEHYEVESRKCKIETEAPKIFNALWTYILDDIRHANRTEYVGTLHLITQGNAALHDMEIIKPYSPEPKRVKVTMSEDNHTINISGAVRYKFAFDLCRGDAVCLKDAEGNEIQLRAASRRILDPLLFPHLQAAQP